MNFLLLDSNRDNVKDIVLDTAEDNGFMEDIKSSFVFWQKKKKPVICRQSEKLKHLLQKILKIFTITVSATLIIGPLCGHAKDISTYFS